MAAVWRIRSLHLPRTETKHPTPHLVEGVPWEAVWATMHQLAELAAEGFVAMTAEGVELYGAVCVAMMGEGVQLYGAVCPLPKRCSTFIPVNRWNQSTSNNPAMQDYIGCRLPGTSRHEASYVHCRLGGTSRPDELAS